jgi:hypothetical protein
MDGFNPATAQNNPDIEKQWAVVAFEFAQEYYYLLTTTNPKKLMFTSLDDQIYVEFRSLFTEMDVTSLNVDDFKNDKEKWRAFINQHENGKSILIF